jgi:hypothetical protein
MRLYMIAGMSNQQAGNMARQRDASALWGQRRPEIVKLYVEGDWSQARLAAHFGVTQQAIGKALRRMGLAAKPKSRVGEANGRYIHGREVRVYRTMIEKTHCSKCATTDDLCIHHRDGDHYNNEPDNLEVMCMSCHTSMHKAEWWRSRKAGQS